MTDNAKDLRQQAAGGTFCIVPYCHPDFSWTHHREWHEERYAVSTCEALDLMREHEEFRFCMEPWIDHVQPFLERCPDRIEELRERLNSGEMGVKAFTMTSPRPATCPDETFLRNMIFGRRMYRQFAPEADLTVMACPDVGIGHSQMPQIVKLAGGRMYRGWRSDSAFSFKGIPRDFIWRGLDGTELITSRGIYGGLVSPELIPDDFADRWEELVERLFAGPLAQSMDCSESKTWWVAQGMDDARPLRGHGDDKLLPIIEFVNAWNEREDSAMVFATPNEYRERLEGEDLPVWEGVIDQVDVAYNSGWHGERGLWRLRQQLDTAMVICERACALAELLTYPPCPPSWREGGKVETGGRDKSRPCGRTGQATCPTDGPDTSVANTATSYSARPERLEELWIETMRIASHAQQWVFEKDWDWLTSRARYALREINEETEKAVSQLAGVGRRSDAKRPLVLFNPLPYPREEIIEVPWVQPRVDLGGHRVWDADGDEAPLQLGEQAGNTFGGRIVEAPLIFKAQVPAMGCAVYDVGDGPVSEAPAPPEDDAVDNGELKLRLSERGLQQVTDTATGMEWQAPLGSCIGDCMLFEMGPGVLHIGPITAELSGQTGSGNWILAGPMRWVYRWETEFHGHRVRQDVILDAGCRHVDFLTRVFCAGANGFFALCFDLPIQGEMHVDIPFGVEARDLTDEPYATNMPPGSGNIERHRENQFWARSFASVGQASSPVGIALITADGDKYWTYDADTGASPPTPLRNGEGRTATTRLRHILFTPLDDVEEGWEAWVTKDRLALGWHEFRHRLVFHDGDWRAADICGESDRLRLPLHAVKPLGLPCRPDNPVGRIVVQPASVRLSALYQVPEGYVLRIYESAGEPAEVTVSLPAGFSQATRADLNLEPLDATVALDTNKLTLPLRPWEIATVLLTP